MAKFSNDEWQRARDRLASLTNDEALLDAFDRARRAGEIDADLLRRLQWSGIAVSDLFGAPRKRIVSAIAAGGGVRPKLDAHTA